MFANKKGSQNDCDTENETHIDFEYYSQNRFNDTISEEPLDLSMKNTQNSSTNRDDIETFKEAINFTDNLKVQLVTEKDLFLLITPFMVYDEKKVICKICEIKFISPKKAKTHIENKHKDDKTCL